MGRGRPQPVPCTFTETSATKTSRQSASMPSVRPQGGSQGGARKRTSAVLVSDEGVSMKAKARTKKMVKPRALEGRQNMAQTGQPAAPRPEGQSQSPPTHHTDLRTPSSHRWHALE